MSAPDTVSGAERDTSAVASAANAPANATTRGIRRRLLRFGLVLTALALAPKCVLCVIGYVAVLSGLGVQLCDPSAPDHRTDRWLLAAIGVTIVTIIVTLRRRRQS